MKPWEHPKTAEALKKLRPLKKIERTLHTPEGPVEFTITHYIDKEGNQYLEIKSRNGNHYLLAPKQVLARILADLEEE